MNKIEKGKARVEKLNSIIANILEQDDEGLSNLQDSGLIKLNGEFDRGHLANAVGMDTETATFRQNKALKQAIKIAETKLRERGIATEEDDNPSAKTTVAVGEENERSFLSWLSNIGTEESPAPVNHFGRLYKKALWSQYSEQPLLEVKRTPAWFNSRDKVRVALEELDVKVVQGSVVILKMDADSISDDMENSMTSALVRKLRVENKELRDKLEAEIEARKEAELRAEQNAMMASQAPTGKMARN